MMVVLLPDLPAGQQLLNSMKILLRNKATGFFYAGGNQWTADIGGAHDFKTGLNALQYSTKVPLAGVEFIYVRTDPTEDFVLPRLAIYSP